MSDGRQRAARRFLLHLLAVLTASASLAIVGDAVAATPPTTFSVSPSSPTAGSAATFTAGTLSCLLDSCEWSFESGGARVSGRTASHTYAIAGTYKATLYDGLLSEETEIVVVAPPNQAPTVSVSGPANTFRNTATTFELIAEDNDGTIKSTDWNVSPSAGVSGSGGTFSFANAGIYQVTATVTDDDNAETTTDPAASVRVSGRQPTVSVEGPQTLNIGVVGRFSMKPRDMDGDSTIKTRAWRIDNGPYVLGGNLLETSFAGAGQHKLSARVTDDEENAATADFSVNVANKLPTVDFSWSPRVVDKGDVVTFTSSSADPDGKPLARHEWDLDGDGRFDDGFGDTATRTYTSTGSRTIRLRVTDADGDAAIGSRVLVPGNRPPSASFTATPSLPVVGQAVLFASTSKDGDGKIASQAWDLNGDNVYGEGTGTGASTAFSAVGTHRVGLKVTDDDGSTDIKFVNVVVKPSSGVAGVSSVKSLRILRPFPKVRFAGALTRRGAMIKLLSVKAPKGAKISITCKRGCPRSKVARLARTVRVKSMHGAYRSGAVLVITVTKSNAIGKYTRITIVKGKAPKRIDRCLWPRSKKPRACPPGVGLN